MSSAEPRLTPARRSDFRFDRRTRPRPGGGRLDTIRVRTAAPRAILFVPPLIGGDLAGAIRPVRPLLRAGCDLITFSYAGHGRSSDPFSLSATLRDTAYMLDDAARLSRRAGLPLFGLAVCYAAIPAIHAAAALGEPFTRLALVNAVADLGPKAIYRSFRGYVGRLPRTPAGLRQAAHDYLDFLFPEVAKGRDRFGVLERRRTGLLRTAAEGMTLRPLAGIHLPATPVLSLYAREDRILRIYGATIGRGGEYEDVIRRVCPLARFIPVDGDHFLSRPTDRADVRRSLLSFFGLPLSAGLRSTA